MTSERSLLRTVGKFGTVFLVNVAVLAFLVLGFGREYVRNREIDRNIRELETQNEELSAKKLEALSVIASLSSEYYLESEARRKHGLAKPGEELVIVHDASAAARDSAVSDEDARTTNVLRWFQYFFDHDTFDALRAL